MKKTGTNYPLKFPGVVLCTTLFIGLFSRAVLAEGMDVYGTFTTDGAYSKLNPYSLTANAADLNTYLGGDLYFQKKDENQIQYLMDLRLDGSLVDSQPFTLTVNQLYVMVPFSDQTFLYCGKKIKEIGVSNFFNVSNLLSPKYLFNNSYTRDGTGLLELDRIQSDVFSYGLITNFQNAANWDQVQGVVFTDARFGNFYLEDYLYLQESAGSSLGLDATYQMGKYQLYLESILKSWASRQVVLGNSGVPVDDFSVQELQNCPAVVLGGSITVDNFMAALEYFYNGNGYDASEQAAFMDYFKQFPNQAANINNYYNRCTFTQNYLGLTLSQANFLNKKVLTFNLSTLVSFQPGGDYQADTSYEVTTNLDYTFKQNLDFNFYLTYRNGGNYGEFNRLYSDLVLSLLINYNF